MPAIACPPRPTASARFRARVSRPKGQPVKLRAYAGGVELAVYGAIGLDGITADDMRRVLATLPPGDVVLNINSDGGDIFDGIAIYNDLKALGRNITARITGIAGSAATLVALAAGRVEIAPTAHFMIHRSWCDVSGNAEELREVADVLASIDENSLIPVYAERTGLARDAIRSMIAYDNYMPASKAVELRFCDALIGAGERPGAVRGAVRTGLGAAPRTVRKVLSFHELPSPAPAESGFFDARSAQSIAAAARAAIKGR